MAALSRTQTVGEVVEAMIAELGGCAAPAAPVAAPAAPVAAAVIRLVDGLVKAGELGRAAASSTRRRSRSIVRAHSTNMHQSGKFVQTLVLPCCVPPLGRCAGSGEVDG